MTKSKLYKIAERDGLRALYDNKVYFINKRANLVEYIHAYNWPPEVLRSHPNLKQYEIRCYGVNSSGVAFRGVALGADYGKKSGLFFFQTTDADAAGILANPASLYI